MAYQSNLLGDFWRSYRQKRIGTGQALSQNEIGGLLGPMLEYDAQKAQQAAQREQQQSQFNANLALQQKAQKDTKLASMVGGVGQLAMLPMAYGAGKNLGWWGAPKTDLLGLTPDQAAWMKENPGVQLGSKTLANPSLTPEGAYLNAAPAPANVGGMYDSSNIVKASTAQGTVAPAAVSTTAQGGAASVPGSMVAETGGAPGIGAVSTAPEMGLLGTASTAALPAALGSTAGRFLGAPISKALSAHPKTTQDVMSVGGGVAAGLLATGGNPIGGVIGGIIGGVSSLF